MKSVFVIDVIRTAIGKYGGALSNVRPDDMLAHVIRSLIERNPSIDVNVTLMCDMKLHKRIFLKSKS